MTSQNKRIAFFPGSFDPFTRGHESIVLRALPLFSHVVIGIGINPDKHPLMSVQQRIEWIKAAFSHLPEVSVTSYTGYTADAARQAGASHIIRGVRNAQEFDYEQHLADYNRQAAGIETILLPSLPDEVLISSTQLRQLLADDCDISHLLPSHYSPALLDALCQHSASTPGK